jgi:HK97 family phage portal protein
LFARRRIVETRAIGDPFAIGGATPHIRGDVEETALRLAAVYGSVRLIADNVATLPFNAYRLLSDGSRSLMPSQPGILTAPSIHGSRIDWLFRLCASLALRGNAYGLPTARDSSGRVSALEWLDPADVDLKYDDVTAGPPEWTWRGRPVPELIHLPLFVLPGRIRGLSPIGAFKTLIEQGLSAEAFGADWFANGSIPAGMVTNETGEFVSQEQAQIVKRRFKESAAGRDIVAMGGGWKYTPLTIPPEESQFLQTIKANATQIAVIFGVPPGKVGGNPGGSLTYATTEMEGIDLSTFTLRPYLVRIETMLTDLLPRPQVVAADMDALQRGSTLDRYNAHAIALNNGWLSRNEVRRAENLKPIDGGDEYVDPAAKNEPPAGQPGAFEPQPTTGGAQGDSPLD